MRKFLVRIVLIATAFSVKANPGEEYKGVILKKTTAVKCKQLTAKVKVFENKIIKKYSKNMIGANFDWNSFEHLGVVLPENKALPKLSPKYIEEMKGIPLPLNRMSGSESQLFH